MDPNYDSQYKQVKVKNLTLRVALLVKLLYGFQWVLVVIDGSQLVLIDPYGS